jgi:hypothetical protein
MPAWLGFERFPGLVCILPFWLPYAFVFLRLRQGRTKSGLLLAVVTGSALFVPGILLLRFLFEWERSWWIRANLGVALVMQPLLVVAAIVALSSMPFARRDWMKMLGTSAYGISLFALSWQFYSPIPRLITYNEGMAKRRLGDMSLDALEFSKEFDGFYPDAMSLTEGKKECHTGMPVDSLLGFLLRPTPEDGYIFDYRTVTAETSVRGCRMAKGYRITARPIAYRKTGIRSFLAYQERPGIEWSLFVNVHATSEDREATSRDPAERVELYKRHVPN